MVTCIVKVNEKLQNLMVTCARCYVLCYQTVVISYFSSSLCIIYMHDLCFMTFSCFIVLQYTLLHMEWKYTRYPKLNRKTRLVSFVFVFLSTVISYVVL